MKKRNFGFASLILTATTILFCDHVPLEGGQITIISAPAATAEFTERVDPVGSSNTKFIGSDVTRVGTGGVLPPTLLPPDYVAGSPIGSAITLGPKNFQVGQNPSDKNPLLSATYQTSLSQRLSFGPAGVGVQIGGSSVLGASNTLDPNQPFSAVDTNHNAFNVTNSSQMVTNAQLLTSQDILFSVSDSATTFNLTLANSGLSLSPGTDLNGNTFAYVENNLTITPIHSIAGFIIPSPANNYNFSQFQNSQLISDPVLKLNSFQFDEHAIYGTHLDANGATVPTDYPFAYQERADLTTGNRDRVLSYRTSQSTQSVTVSITLLPGYVYWLDETVQTGVQFGGDFNGVFQAGSGTYLDPSTALSVSVQQAQPNQNPHTVPEPSSFALLVFGGMGAAFGVCRKRRMASLFEV